MHYSRFTSLPVVTVLVGIVNGVLLPGVVGGVALAGGGDVVLVGIWLCVVVLVGVVGGEPLVGVVGGVPLVGVVGGVPLVGIVGRVPLVVADCVAATVGVRSPVGTGSTVLVLKVVLGPMRKKCMNIMHMGHSFC